MFCGNKSTGFISLALLPLLGALIILCANALNNATIGVTDGTKVTELHFNDGFGNVSFNNGNRALKTNEINGIEGERPLYTTENIKLWGCYLYYSDGWSWQAHSDDEVYEENISPDFCVNHCVTVPSRSIYSIAVIKGHLCNCLGWTDLKLTRIYENYCNFPCTGNNKISNSGDPADCGGNLATSVYCLSDDPKCQMENPDRISAVRGIFTRFMVDEEDEEGKSSTSLETQEYSSPAQNCIECVYGQPCLYVNGFTQNQDYFPLNNPRACAINCKRLRTDTINYTSVRLGWNGYAEIFYPVCVCEKEDPFKNDRFQVVDDKECSSPCPGNSSVQCGRPETFFSVYHITSDFMDNDEYYHIDDTEDDTSTTSTTEVSTTVPTSTLPESTEPIPYTPTSGSTESNVNTTTNTTRRPTTAYTEAIPDATTQATSSTRESSTSTTEYPTVCPLKCLATGDYGETWHGCPGLQRLDCTEIGRKGMATWECLRNGTYRDKANYTGCRTLWYDDMADQVRNQTNGGKPLPKDVSETLLTEMKELCTVTEVQTKPYMGHEIGDIASLLWTIVKSTKLDSQRDGEEVLKKAMDLPGLLLVNPEPWNEIHQDSEKAKMGSDLVSLMERSSFTLYNTVKNDNYHHNFYPSSFNSYQDNLVTFGTGSKVASKQAKLSFPINAPSGSSSISLEKGWELLVNESAFVGVSISLEHIRNIFSPKLISWKPKDSDKSTNSVVNSNLISLQIGVNNYSSESRHLGGSKARVMLEHAVEAWGDKSQTVPRKLHEGETAKVAMGSAVCVFWDVIKGKWSKDGCKVVKMTRTHTECECDHLTSFAVLMDTHKYLAADFAMEVLTLILCPLSVVCLLMSIIIFSAVGAIQCQRTTITKHLCFCLMIGVLLVLFFVDRNYFHLPDGVCTGVGIVTHYFYLAAFVWMAIEGAHLYKMVVRVFDSGRNPTTIYRIMAYGIPAVIIGVTSVTGYFRGDRPYGGDSYCWLEGNYIWSFGAPAAVVVMGNMIILFVALKTASQMNASTKLLQARQRTYKSWIRGSFSITVLLGITWLPGFFLQTHETVAKVAGMLFVILNSSQGIFLFIFHCFMNEKVRIVAERKLSLPTWLSISSSPSREPTQSRKKSDNMKSYNSESNNYFKPGNENSLTRPPKAKGNNNYESPSANPRQNFGADYTAYNNNLPVFSIDSPDPRCDELRGSDSGLSRGSSQNYFVRGNRKFYYHE